MAIDTVHANLSRFKAPRHVVIIDEVKRGLNGKADYGGPTPSPSTQSAEG